ncbi:B12-binding domain-containing radical SAM protein [Proteiniborus sp.]|uniref:B12-binding domain-containing radical SAM protein n=1 Tax=Proteiniborus sp. TaxID=2079015 RepID=UPI0033237EE4
MKILITTLNSKFIHTSLSIRYLKSFVKDDFPDIEIEEYTINQNIDYIVGEIFKKNLDIVAFSCYIWNIESILQISEVLKIVNPNIKIILGGPEVSFDGETLIMNNPFIDFVVYGEGEETFKELLLSLKNKNKNLKSIKGLIFKDEKKVYVNEPRPLIQDLDIIPSPYDSNLGDFKNRIVYFESSRGCPFNCRFCLSSTIRGVRFFSIERVKEDLKKLIDAEVKQVKFVDRTFNAKKEYALEIMNFIMEQNVKNINFHFEVTAHLLDEDVLNFLENVPEGLFQFEIGVQSTNPITLEAIDRKTNTEKLMKVVKKIKSFNNIHQHLDLIAGLPYEDIGSFKKSFNDIYALRPEKLQLGFLKLLKGSELRYKKELYGYKFLDKPPYEVLESNYIKYGEMLQLKGIEDLVEKYANELFFGNSVSYIINNFYDTPFDFFESFAMYWEREDLSGKSHSRVDLYRILLEFYNNSVGEYTELFRNIIRFDFIYNSKSPTIPEFIESKKEDVPKNKKHEFLKKQENLVKYLPEYIDTPAKIIINEVYIERFNYDILKLIKRDNRVDEINLSDTIILFVYKHDRKVFEKCKCFDVTDEFIYGE